jgi:putative ABC transport system permease protein
MRWRADEESEMTLLRQIVSVTAMNIMSLPQRVASSVVVVIGIAGVVAVLVSVFAMSEGLIGTLIATGYPDRVIVLRNGAEGEGASSLSQADVQTIMDAPGIARTSDGNVAASAEMFVSVNVQRREDDSLVGMIVRGVQPTAFKMRSELNVLEGRLFEPGLRELIVGRRAQNEFQGLDIGDEVLLRDGPWTIVGSFDSGGGATESIMLADVSTLQSAFQRTLFNSVRVVLDSPASFELLSDALTTNPTLSVNPVLEPEFFARQAEGVEPLFNVIRNVVGTIMALGALFAALNTMYSAVSTRSVEIATLRAIGFGSGGVVVSVLTEALLLALIGAMLGGSIAWLLFNGSTFSLGGNGGSLVAEMAVTTKLFATGVVWACAVGALGGLFPAIRAARLPVATALRAT